MTFIQALERKEELEKIVEVASKRLQAYPRGNMGMVPDSVRATSEYRADKSAYENAFRALQRFNITFLHTFEREYHEHRRAKRKVNV